MTRRGAIPKHILKYSPSFHLEMVNAEALARAEAAVVRAAVRETDAEDALDGLPVLLASKLDSRRQERRRAVARYRKAKGMR